MPEIVLVTSGTGTVGTELVSRLARHVPPIVVRCGTRNPKSESSKTLRLLSPGVSPSNIDESNIVPVEFDTSKPASMKEALEGVTKVYLLPPFVENMEEWHQEVMDAIVNAKTVKYIVKHSVMGARAPTPESIPGPLPLMHWKGEELVRKSGIPNTVIRPTIFAQHFTAFPFVHQEHHDTFYMPTEEGKMAFLDARDIAELACHLLTLSDPSPHYNQAYNLTGPKAISCQEIAVIWTNVTGKVIKHEGNKEICVERIKRLQPDPFSARSVERVYKDSAEGWLGKWISPDFEKVMGKTSTPFTKFAYDHVALYR